MARPLCSPSQDNEFVVEHVYDRPKSMPNINNEGFAIAPASGCDDGVREVVLGR